MDRGSSFKALAPVRQSGEISNSGKSEMGKYSHQQAARYIEAIRNKLMAAVRKTGVKDAWIVRQGSTLRCCQSTR